MDWERNRSNIGKLLNAPGYNEAHRSMGRNSSLFFRQYLAFEKSYAFTKWLIAFCLWTFFIVRHPGKNKIPFFLQTMKNGTSNPLKSSIETIIQQRVPFSLRSFWVLAFEQLSVTFISRGSVLILLVPFLADFYKGIMVALFLSAGIIMW